MPRDKEGAQRRVYMLPVDLVARISAYQEAVGAQSEVEAVRQLLTAALRMADDWRTICDQILERMQRSETLAEAAKEVLVGHPGIDSISFERGFVVFKMLTGEMIQISANGDVTGQSAGIELKYPGF